MFTYGAGVHFTTGTTSRNLGKATGGATPDQVFAAMAKRRLTTCRFDMILADDTSPYVVMDSLLISAAKYGITLHPILFVPFSFGGRTDGGKYPDTQAGRISQGYNRVYPFALKYGALGVLDYEMQNELTLVSGFKSGDGRSSADYATTPAAEWKDILTGMSRAIEDAKTQTGKALRKGVDIVYVDYGFIPFLESGGLMTIDKVCYHYYYNLTTSPYAISPPSGPTEDIFAKLAALNKPIFINEFNAGEVYDPVNAHRPYNDTNAVLSLAKHLAYMANQTTCDLEGVEIYELYDEPSKGEVEGNFGLIKTGRFTGGTPEKLQLLVATAFADGEMSPAESRRLLRAFMGAPA